MNKYPTVFVHGYIGWGEGDPIADHLGYWGQGKKNILAHLSSEGYEVHAPALGPYTSTWDRSCELYAYLFGGRVDFGKVHSEKYGHDRYGATYEGVLKDLGKTEAHTKINLIGHSFGGPTVKVFTELMCRGFQEEIDGTDPEDLSPLFAGGHGDLIHSCTTLSGVNNGTTFDMLSRPVLWLATVGVLSNEMLLGAPLEKERRLRLEHYGISGPKSAKGILQYAHNTWDTATFEMTPPFAEKLNAGQDTNPHIYYFAHRADCSKKFLGKRRLPAFRDTSAACRVTSLIMGCYLPPKFHVNPAWYPNDGFVNVLGQSAPFNAPQQDGEFGMEFQPGKWYNMPIIRGDHLWWNGIEAKKKELFAYYDRMLSMLQELPDA